jgi:hypothetical protein
MIAFLTQELTRQASGRTSSSFHFLDLDGPLSEIEVSKLINEFETGSNVQQDELQINNSVFLKYSEGVIEQLSYQRAG